MSKAINVGQGFTSTVSGNPTPASGSVTANVTGTGISLTNNGDNTFRIVGVTPNTLNTVVYSAPGFQSASESVTVNALPALVVTEGATA